MKDNFSNSNPFGRNKSKYSEHLENYIGMVNQPTAADAFGDAFSQAGSAPAVGAQAHEANALLSGIGAGIKGAANSQRQEKLSPYMQMTAQLTAKAAELEAQMQEEQQNSIQVKQFFKQNASPIAELSKSSLAGDTQASNQIAQGILRNYKQTFGDETVGNFDHYHNGTIYYENLETGAVEGRNVSSLMYQAGINPVELFGQDAPAIEAGLSAGAKLNYENTLEANRLALEKERAGINMTNAHTGLYNTQRQNAALESSPEYQRNMSQTKQNDKTYEYRAKHNTEQLVPKISEQYQKNNDIISSASELKGILQNTNLAGGSPMKAIARYVANITGNDESVINAKNAGQFYMEWMNQNTKGALSDNDIKLYKETFADITKNKDASINILTKLEQKLQNQNTNFTKQLKLYDEDAGANLNSLEIIKPNNNSISTEYQQNNNAANDMVNSNQQQGMVQMQAPDGSIRAVPMDQAEKWKSRGATIVNE